jgi:hypothetical protein
MPVQLSLFGPQEAPPSAEAASPPLPREPEVDPRQGNLFEGHVPLLCALEAACEQLDVAAAHGAWEKLLRRFPEWACSQAWPGWLRDLTWLAALERTHEGGEHARQVLALREPGRAAEWLRCGNAEPPWSSRVTTRHRRRWCERWPRTGRDSDPVPCRTQIGWRSNARCCGTRHSSWTWFAGCRAVGTTCSPAWAISAGARRPSPSASSGRP